MDRRCAALAPAARAVSTFTMIVAAHPVKDRAELRRLKPTCQRL
jgi:hypothetical protein